MAEQTERRRDPQKRPPHFDGSADWTRLKNKDPERRYVGIYLSDEDALRRYEGMGYEPCVNTKGGVTWAFGNVAEGAPLERRGYAIYSISKKRHDEIERFGPDGQSGQAWADEIENRIIDKRKGVLDLLRGSRAGSQYIRAEHNVGELERAG